MLAKKTLYYFILIFYIFLSLIFHTTLFHQILGHFKPNFLLILTVYIALYRSIPEGGLLSLLSGYFFDIFSGAPQGLYMCAFILVFFYIKVLSQAFYIHAKHLEALCIFLGSLIYFVLILVLLLIFTDALVDPSSFILRAVFITSGNTFIAVILYPYFRKFDLFIHKREKGTLAST